MQHEKKSRGVEKRIDWLAEQIKKQAYPLDTLLQGMIKDEEVMSHALAVNLYNMLYSIHHNLYTISKVCGQSYLGPKPAHKYRERIIKK